MLADILLQRQIDDTMKSMLKWTPELATQAGEITELLDGIGR